MADQQDKKTIIKSVRLSPRDFDLIRMECRTEDVSFSEFLRVAAISAAETIRELAGKIE